MLNWKWRTIFKASSTNHGTKSEIIKKNKAKFSIAKMCRLLGVCRSVYYYTSKTKSCKTSTSYEKAVVSAFKDSKEIYGTRKIKAVLRREGIIISRRRISVILHKNSLKSKYTVLRYRNNKQLS